MSELTYKKIIDVEQVETLNDAATVFINDNGAMKQVGADKFGAVKTVNGVVPDENGNIVVEIPELAKPDWNQNDPTAADYVKNRTHYLERVATKLVNGATVTTVSGQLTGDAFAMDDIVEGNHYTVTWDGAVYECVSYMLEGMPAIGNGALGGMSGGDNEPFLIGAQQGSAIVFANTGTHTISIEIVVETVHTIDPKYLPASPITKLLIITTNTSSMTASANLSYDEIKTTLDNGDVIIGCEIQFGAETMNCNNINSVSMYEDHITVMCKLYYNFYSDGRIEIID